MCHSTHYNTTLARRDEINKINNKGIEIMDHIIIQRLQPLIEVIEWTSTRQSGFTNMIQSMISWTDIIMFWFGRVSFYKYY